MKTKAEVSKAIESVLSTMAETGRMDRMDVIDLLHEAKNVIDADMYESMLIRDKGASDSINRESVIVPSEPVAFTTTVERALDAEQVLRLIEIIKETGGAVEVQGVRIEPMSQVECRGE